MRKTLHWQIKRTFKRLGVWSIPILSMPLVGALVVAKSLPPAPVASSKLHSQKIKEVATQPTVKQPATKSSPSKARTAKPVKTHQTAKKKKTPPKYTAPTVEIKVAIAIDVPSVVVGSSTAAQLLDRNRKSIGQKLLANQPFEIQPQDAGLLLANRQLPPVVWIQPQTGGYVYVGDRWYRGKVLLVSQGSSMLVVNYVNLEQYLASVVGSEMHPDAPLEALKAQAIAARSYATVHLLRPASPWYNLGATERWQVYKGLESEWNTSKHAVDATAGQVLSHQGGVVESLYAASDEIVLEAHGGRGMSQQGAYNFAAQGYNHQQILQAYYPGVNLARLERQK